MTWLAFVESGGASPEEERNACVGGGWKKGVGGVGLIIEYPYSGVPYVVLLGRLHRL